MKKEVLIHLYNMMAESELLCDNTKNASKYAKEFATNEEVKKYVPMYSVLACSEMIESAKTIVHAQYASAIGQNITVLNSGVARLAVYAVLDKIENYILIIEHMKQGLPLTQEYIETFYEDGKEFYDAYDEEYEFVSLFESNQTIAMKLIHYVHEEEINRDSKIYIKSR